MKVRYEKAQAFMANLADNSPELPFEPTLLPELFSATAESSLQNAAHIAGLVERSQGLAARILRLANAAYYGMQTKVSSLSRAVQLLGLHEVRNIILQLGVSSAVGKLPLPKAFPFEKLWEHQLFTANMARALANAMAQTGRTDGGVSPDELYAAGLLHDMGKTMLAAFCPDEWAAIRDLEKTENISFAEAEEQYWGLDHAVVGARLLTFWGIPRKLTELVSWHHLPRHAKAEYQAAARILAAANLLAHTFDNADAVDVGALDVPETVTAIFPEGFDQEGLQKSFARCDVDRIRSMAKMTLEQ